MEPPAATGANSPIRFNTTLWGLVRASADKGSGDFVAAEALAKLCKIYWRPVFAFICRRGFGPVDAQDLTQDFFVKVLRGNLLKVADPERGRFRSLLQKALVNFLNDVHAKRSAKKRGGEMNFISLENWVLQSPSQLRLPTSAIDSWPPARLFDVRWAATVVEQALLRLREECQARGRRRAFDVLRGTLTAPRGEISYAALGKKLHVDALQIKRLIYALRRRYRELLREEVAQTVARPEDVEEELRYLCRVIAEESGAPAKSLKS